VNARRPARAGNGSRSSSATRRAPCGTTISKRRSIEGLQQKIEGAELHRLDGAGDRAVGGQYDHRHVGGRLRAWRARNSSPADAGHAQIGEHEVDLVRGQEFEGRAQRSRGRAIRGRASRSRSAHTAHPLLVVDDQHRFMPKTPRATGSSTRNTAAPADVAIHRHLSLVLMDHRAGRRSDRAGASLALCEERLEDAPRDSPRIFPARRRAPRSR